MVGTSVNAAAQDHRLDSLLSAVVEVRAHVPGQAPTVRTLGAERTGSDVTIDASGLIVTIGYLILEAERAEVRTADRGWVPARILAYDHDSGFGLLRALTPLAVDPMPLGESQRLTKWDRVMVASFGGLGAARPAVAVDRRPFAGYWEYLLDDAIFTSPPHRRSAAPPSSARTEPSSGWAR